MYVDIVISNVFNLNTIFFFFFFSFFKHSTGYPSSPGALPDLISFTASLTSSNDIALSFKSHNTGIRQLPTSLIFASLTSATFWTCSKCCAHLLLTSTPSRNIWPLTSFTISSLACSPFITRFTSFQNIFLLAILN